MIKIGIYKITSPSNKIYIGQSINIKRRFNQYRLLDKSSIGPKLYNSLKKHGPKNHKFEILEECYVQELNGKEVHYKLEYNSIQLDLEGNFIKDWCSIRQAGLELRGTTGETIRKCLKGLQKTAYGYKWKYK